MERIDVINDIVNHAVMARYNFFVCDFIARKLWSCHLQSCSTRVRVMLALLVPY
jgi:hypothetical protein